MRKDEREQVTSDEGQGEPAAPAKVHGDVLEDLIPRDPREAHPRKETEDEATRRESSPEEG